MTPRRLQRLLTCHQPPMSAQGVVVAAGEPGCRRAEAVTVPALPAAAGKESCRDLPGQMRKLAGHLLPWLGLQNQKSQGWQQAGAGRMLALQLLIVAQAGLRQCWGAASHAACTRH